jgi:uncharacterized protein YgbK (DUF1537 family)
VAEGLAGLKPGGVCVVNSASYRDIEVFVLGLLTAEERGQQFLYRTAASFVRARAGLPGRPLLTQADLDLSDSGAGLFIVGSHVPRTTSQVNALLAHPGIVSIEINVKELLEEQRWENETKRAAQQADRALRRNQDVLIYTSRQLIIGEDADSSLSISQRVSEGLVTIVQDISTRPRYLVAKGGITSSDVATRGLGIKRAMVPGQILPGVPVWRLGSESRYPAMPYIVFPGNVGGPEALVEIVTAFRRE